VTIHIAMTHKFREAKLANLHNMVTGVSFKVCIRTPSFAIAPWWAYLGKSLLKNDHFHIWLWVFSEEKNWSCGIWLSYGQYHNFKGTKSFQKWVHMGPKSYAVTSNVLDIISVTSRWLCGYQPTLGWVNLKEVLAMPNFCFFSCQFL